MPLLPANVVSPVKEEDSDPHQAGTIPPWVHINDSDEKARFLPPEPSVPNTRHYKPPTKYEPGRKWDAFRTAEPGLLSMPIADHQTRWIPFMQSGPNPREYRGEGVVKDEQWMAENTPIFTRGWEEEDEIDPQAKAGQTGMQGIAFLGKWLISPERQERTVKFFWRMLLKNAFVPLVFRLTILTFSAAAAGVAGTILSSVHKVNEDPDPSNQCAPRASTYMGIIVGSIGVPYIAYITWDEYMSKPLGLRSVAAKTLLLLCDLYFIVFSASNLSLAFSALLDDSWACYDISYQVVGDVPIAVSRTCPNNPGICSKQKALTGVLFVALVAWLLCFSISVLRVVEKLRLDY
ncbi:Regulator of phospholipase D SRF1 [Fulvia fulva]|uniref:Regulator of phospholipase D SRF1 n=1 Tax=Passalora fulva TaxID=5499 RepID=A0A9Q8L9B0_PASFU|nr:Regulator of phospholipase D SRF1 [Fulvia fulva]KAK4632060.1 Regulator of phospholipase D SRF1 [Fulvia fulva]KAK4633011.1 Regulator of phospholipase D SRF1 [Fulvia fulva]UJO13311.1 Regulator of phospholipase D SRF1 [Fulvia fulva]WPV11772.1 Regulator of phospholipase D SRF1 [Fulvia fulva]WPV25517.1 Regulator of phospholipase D SRF1 [Fulvia fulva]